MRTTIQIRNNPVGDAVINASRQVWLASLGAAVVTRDWAQSEAGAVFRTLVKEGTAVESRTIRMVGDRIEDSFAMANSFWKQARTTVQNHGASRRPTRQSRSSRTTFPKRCRK